MIHDVMNDMEDCCATKIAAAELLDFIWQQWLSCTIDEVNDAKAAAVAAAAVAVVAAAFSMALVEKKRKIERKKNLVSFCISRGYLPIS